jgi:hypothetical protein
MAVRRESVDTQSLEGVFSADDPCCLTVGFFDFG